MSQIAGTQTPPLLLPSLRTVNRRAVPEVPGVRKFHLGVLAAS